MHASLLAAPEHDPRHASQGVDPALLGETVLMQSLAPKVLPPVYESGDLHAAATSFEAMGPHPDRFRTILHDLTPQESGLFDDYLATCAQWSTGRHGRLSRKPEGEPWAAWIAREADPDDMLSILTEHNRTVAAMNEDPVVANLLEERREWTADRLQEGAGRWFSSHALELARGLREDVRMWFGDDLRDVALRQGALAYCAPDRTYVVMRQDLATVDRIQRRQAAIRRIYSNVGPHELLHAEGVAEWLPNWMVEVAVEDMTQTILLHDVREALNPDSSETYVERRRIRQTLLRQGAEEIDELIYLRAVSSEGAESHDFQLFEAALARSWGIDNPMKYVTRRIVAYEETIRDRYKGDPAYTHSYINSQAAIAVNRELIEDPRKVFGPHYKKTQPHTGAATSSRARHRR